MRPMGNIVSYRIANAFLSSMNKRHKIFPVGSKFGYWTVIGEGNPTRSAKGKIYYTSRCKCICGTVQDVKNETLVRKRGGSKSCGCMRGRYPRNVKATHPDFFINGYRVIYRPEHKTNSGFKKHPGYIYEHRYVMEIFLGRSLDKTETVHHKDGNRDNNNLSNLELLLDRTHSYLHGIERAKKLGKHLKEERICRICGMPTSKFGTLCGKCARQKSIKIKLPPLDEFQKMINELPLKKVAQIVGVSSHAVRKWIKKIGLQYIPFYKRKVPSSAM